MALKTNQDQLVSIAVQGKVANAYRWNDFEISFEGQPFTLPSTGSITYNVKVGDRVFGWEGDHVEPGVSAILDEKKRRDKANAGFNSLACSGNKALLVSGDAKGEEGVVIGHHGGVEHVIIDFPDETLDKMTLDDKILIRTIGQGLRLVEYPDVFVYNLSPALFEKMKIRETNNGSIEVPVTTIVPAYLMGSGLGSLAISSGDYDVMTSDPEACDKYGLDKLRFGDFVAIEDHDNRYGRSYRKGAITIGIVIHGNCLLAGHGPGVTTLITSHKPVIIPRLDPHANIAEYLKIGRFRNK